MRKVSGRLPLRRIITAITTLALLGSGVSVNAYQTDNLLVYLDAGNTASYNSAVSTSVWNDLSTTGYVGTIRNTLTQSGGALNFAGGYISSNSLAPHVDLGAGLANFGTGITIETEANFGAVRGIWERIFDFGNGAENDNIWLGRYSNSDEIAIEIWTGSTVGQPGNTPNGRCKTADTVNAIPANAPSKKFTVTLDGSVCRIYIDGAEVETEVDYIFGNSTFDNFTNNPNMMGSRYEVLPRNVTRNNNYIGRSNWGSDAAFEGSVKYLRIYTAALTAQAVQNNATTTTPSSTLTYSTTGADSGSAPAAYVGDGAMTLSANTGNLLKAGHQFAGWATSANQSTAISNSYTLSANITLYPVFQVAVVVPGTPGTPTATISNTTASVSWAAPSTGTSPFTYAVTSSPAGATCTVTNLTASCTGLTAGTSYTFSVTATNTAGTSSASAASNSVLASAAPVQQNNPAPPPSPALQVVSPIDNNSAPRPINVTPGQSQTLLGSGLEQVSTVRIGNLTAAIGQKTGNKLNVQIPKSLPAGKYKIELIGTFGTITQEDFLEVPKKTTVKVAAGFPMDSAKMSKTIKAKVLGAVSTLDGAIRAVCIGSTSGTVPTVVAKKLARARATAACEQIKRLNPDFNTSIQINPASGLGAMARNTTVKVYNY